jgi:hypothetical protein
LGLEGGTLQITKNVRKRSKIRFLNVLTDLCDKNNSKPCLESKTLHFWSFLQVLGRFSFFHDFFMVFEKKIPKGKISAEMAFEIQLDDVSMMF